MTTDLQPPLERLTDWVRASDEKAAERLRLIARARRILAAAEEASAEERAALSDRLERWRYECLDPRAGKLSREDRLLVDALDATANELAGRSPRPPRRPRVAVADTSYDHEPVRRAVTWLDGDRPLKDVAEQAAELTRENFSDPATGRRRMLLYAPLYLSSHCVNVCTYCGFRNPHGVERRHLEPSEAVGQAEILLGRGFRHILLVAGDFPRLTTTDYFAGIARSLVERGIRPAVEIAPQATSAYASLAAAGVCGVTLYQETYQEELYTLYHPRGSKASYDWRLEGLERAAEAGIGRLGLGILLGLADPRGDLLAMIRHAAYLRDRFPEHTLAFSLPRIHEAPEGFEVPFPVDDETFVRLYGTLRVAFPRAELVLSTREPASLRNHLAEICITQMSAGSCTIPGGYEDAHAHDYGQQFPVSDHRPPSEVADWLDTAGFVVAWEV